ncbi:hypothetical protein THASP1DRAFT_29147 [Thamnocephalis sphaerospora]|uniref:RGS domain-containing protein n=1 Tax=Thamnocephalis sphaerospora TaxID=78915 RepID=A0A4P9XSE8_9FUNG|nr:hypothetical protein THASP1DRAFT_29147 [Thamnocephalis sphaerospora]|eukprot:RKP09064.1 hypothetical protein THASP1DRAFT_29147 [Thamnocephalis sphaerospora]
MELSNALYKAFAIMADVIYVVDLAVYVWLARTEAPLRHRGVLLTCVHTLATIVFTTLIIVRDPSAPQSACEAAIWMFTISLTLWVTSLALKYWRHMWLYTINRERLIKDNRRRREILEHAQILTPLTRFAASQSYDSPRDAATLDAGMPGVMQPPASDAVSTSTNSANGGTQARLLHQIIHLHFMRPEYHLYLIMLLLLLHITLALAVAILLPSYKPSPYAYSIDCRRPWPYFPVYVTMCLYYVLWLPVFTVLVWRSPDAHGIRYEMMLQTLIGNLTMLLYAVFRYMPGHGWDVARRYYPPAMMLVFGFAYSHALVVLWPIGRVVYNRERLSERRDRRQSSGTLYGMSPKTLDETLSSYAAFLHAIDNPRLREDLSAFSVRDFTTENVLFLRRLRELDLLHIRGQASANIDNYYAALAPQDSDDGQSQKGDAVSGRHTISARQKSKSAIDGDCSDNRGGSVRDSSAQADNSTDTIGSAAHIATLPHANTVYSKLKQIYEEFIDTQSEHELNLTSECHERIMQEYMQGTFSLRSLDQARDEVLQLLFHNTWPRLLHEKRSRSR